MESISNFVNNTNNIIHPLTWVLPNKKQFIEWVNTTFQRYKATKKNTPSKNRTFSPFLYQKLLRDYMQANSPFRGILLYHGLGSGKSCSSILIAEHLKTEKNIVVMLPASLKNNFITDGLLFCGDPLYQTNSSAYKEKYSFISYNANNTIAQLKRIGNLDNKVIIIDEVHNLVSKMISGISGTSKQGLEIYQMLMNAQNVKIVAMSGTPIINDPFELAVLCNILRGPIELSYFSIRRVGPSYGDAWKIDGIQSELLKNENIDMVDINKINKTMEFHIKIKSYHSEFRNVIDFIEKKCAGLDIIVHYTETIQSPLFPIEKDGDVFREMFVKQDLQHGDRLMNESIFRNRILGLISYYKAESSEYPAVIKKDFYRIEMSNYQFQIYDILRAKERLTERGPRDRKKQVKSTFRVFSRQASNFVFPEDIPRPYPDPKFVISLKNKTTRAPSNKLVERAMLLEERANNDGELSEDYKKRIDMALTRLVENGPAYFTPANLAIYSPKMLTMLENIQKKEKGLIFVYSNFRTLEGVELFSKVLDFNGYSKYGSHGRGKTYAIYSGMEDDAQKKEIIKIFTSPANKYGEHIQILMATSATCVAGPMPQLSSFPIRLSDEVGGLLNGIRGLAAPDEAPVPKIVDGCCPMPPATGSLRVFGGFWVCVSSPKRVPSPDDADCA